MIRMRQGAQMKGERGGGDEGGGGGGMEGCMRKRGKEREG